MDSKLTEEELEQELKLAADESDEEALEKLSEPVKTKVKELSKGKTKASKKKEVEQDSNPHAALDQVLRQLRENNEDLIIGRGDQEEVDTYINYERSPFSITNLNALLAKDGKPENGGAPHGRFTTLYGGESSGKTTLAIDAIGRRLLSHPDEYALILDAENSVDGSWYSHFGLDPSRVIVIPGTMPLEDMATEGVRTLKACRDAGIKISMGLVDSLGAMAPAVEMEGKKQGRVEGKVDLRTDHVATSARKINQMLRVWAPQILRSNTCMFLIAHTMMDIGGYGGMVMKGGQGLKHFSHLILKLSRKGDATFEKELLCRDGQVRKIKTGFFVEAKVEKTKISGFQDQSVALPFIIGVGFQTNMAILNSAFGYGILEKSGSWVKYKGENVAQGAAKALEWLDTNPDKRILIEQELSAAMYDKGSLS